MEETKTDELDLKGQELQMLQNNKEEGYNFRWRRQEDWRENYMLYRDKVIINRLTQRQSVNLPLMKSIIKTTLKDVDDMPVLYFENLDNDKQAEVFKNEFWKYTADKNKMELQDIVDKKQVCLFGRSFDKWQIKNGKIKMTIVDPQDILISRYMDPTDLHSSRYLIHTHIFKPLSTLVGDSLYDQEAVKRLQKWYATEMGLIKAADNQKMLVEKNQKMQDMGVPDVESPVLGEAYVELTEHFIYRNDEKDSDGNLMPEQIFLYVEADNMEILRKKPLEEIIGVTVDHYWRNHFPLNTWADDLERQDFWSDAIADIGRTPNKVVNAWFSQEVENRTLANANLKYYDSTIEGFVPPTNQPIVAGGWYPLPGKPSEVFQDVVIEPLNGNLDGINFIIAMVEKATGATQTNQGAQSSKQVTLGEIKLALTEAKARIQGMSKFYTQAWKDRGEMFYKLIEAAADQIDEVKIYKKGRNTNDIYSRVIAPKDWMTENGYRCKVWSQEEKNNEDTNTLQKQSAVKTAMPDNPKVNEIYQRKLLEWAGYTPDEINDVMEFETQKREAIISQLEQAGIAGVMGAPGMGGAGQPAQQQPPAQEPVVPQVPVMQ